MKKLIYKMAALFLQAILSQGTLSLVHNLDFSPLTKTEDSVAIHGPFFTWQIN